MEQYTVYTEPNTGAVWRDGTRGLLYVIDRAITATGFAGVEGTDWENVWSLD